MTEDEQDVLPEGWVRARLGDLVARGEYGTSVRCDYQPGGTPVLRIPNIAKGVVSLHDLKRATASIGFGDADYLLPGDMLMCRTNGSVGLIGKTAVITEALPHQTAFASYLLRFRFLDGVTLPLWVHLFHESPEAREFIEKNAASSAGQHNISMSLMRTLPIPLAPLAEQSRIVATIETLLSKVSLARERLERLPTTMKRFRQAVLATACSGRLTADWRAAKSSSANAAALLATLGVTPLSENVPDEDLPESWVWVRFGDILAEFKNGLSTKPKQSPPGTPILRINAVRPCEVSFADLRYLVCSDEQNADFALRNGDLLFTRYNGSLDLLGVCGLVRGINGQVLVYPDKLMRGRVGSPLILAEYCEKFFSSPAARERMVAKAKSSAGQNGVSGSDVKSQPLALPPTDEQEEIVRRVCALFALADLFEQRATSALKRTESLTQAVLAKAFRGELVPTEAELARRENRPYEPADQLLDRIRAAAEAKTKFKKVRKVIG